MTKKIFETELMTLGSASASDVPWNLVRFYIGLEDPGELLQDIEAALASV